MASHSVRRCSRITDAEQFDVSQSRAKTFAIAKVDAKDLSSREGLARLGSPPVLQCGYTRRWRMDTGP